MAAWLPFAIQGGASVLSSFLGANQSRRNINATNKANMALAEKRYGHDREMAEYAFDKNLEMWHLQNQYNSPEEQMQRFEDAGLSKHMIYGQGTPGNATGMPSYTPPSYQPPTLDYRGKQNVLGEGLGSFMGATAGMMELGMKRQEVIQSQIKTDIDGITAKYFEDIKAEQLKGQELNNRLTQATIGYNEWKTGLAKEYGLTPSDNKLLRMFFQGLQQKGVSQEDLVDWIEQGFKDLKNLFGGMSQGAIFDIIFNLDNAPFNELNNQFEEPLR